jgi:hypothetical protein
MRVVNLTRSKGLNHNQFQNFSSELGTECGGLVSCSEDSVAESQQNSEARTLFGKRSPTFHGIKREICSWVSGSTVGV